MARNIPFFDMFAELQLSSELRLKLLGAELTGATIDQAAMSITLQLNVKHPLPEEEDACIEHLRAQVRIIRPKLLVCLGRISAQRLIKPDFRITREHGVWFSRGAFEMCAVYHPSALLRDPSKREDMLEDMRSIAEKYRALN